MTFEDPTLTTNPSDWPARLREVEGRLRSHEDVCAERYSRLRDDHIELRTTIASSRIDMNKRVDTIQHLLIKIALALLTGMAGILATIVFFK
jgi:hypothetical protein